MPDVFKIGSRDLMTPTKVGKSAVALGTQGASQSGFTYYPVVACVRGLMWRLVVTADTVGSFDLDLRDAAAGGGNQWLSATGITTLTYDISVPVYIEGDAAGTLYLGIKNTHSSSHTFTLTTLGVEKFA